MNRFYGQNFQDKFIFERYFRDTKNGISIECGAFDGIIESSTLFFEETLEWNTINIESSPPIFELLKDNRKNSININKGLGDNDSILIFEHAIHPIHGIKFGNGSFNYSESHKKELILENCEFVKYEVKTTTYKNLIDDIMEKNFKGRKVNLFVLDVEGFEIQVLKGLEGSKYLPEIMCIEFPHVGLDNLKKYLSQLDYKFDIIKDNNAFFLQNKIIKKYENINC